MQRVPFNPFTEAGWDVALWSSLDPNESEIAGDGGRAIVVSNEFLDALPTHLLRVSGEQVEDQWLVSDQAGGGSSAAPDLREEWSTLSTPALAELDLLFGATSAARR